MRIALLTFYPEDTRLIPGGIRMVSYNLVEGLRTYEGLDLHVIHCHSDISEERTVREGNVTLHYLAMPRQRLVPNLMTSIGRLVVEIRALQPDLIHAHVGHFAYAGVRSRVPTIYTIHGVLPRERQVYSHSLYDRLRYGLLAYYEGRALGRVQQLVAISAHVQAEYQQVRGVPWARINNPVPQDFFRLADRTVAGRVLYAGSITEIKDLLTLVRAIERARHTHPEIVLRIAGRVTSAAYDRQVRAYIAERHLEQNVQFLGLLDRQTLMDEYERCAVVALSSLQENAPMVVIEGMAAGKPVVATRVGGVPDLISEGQNGFIVPVGDGATLARRLEQLLDAPALGQRMGQKGRQMAQERFGVEQIARAYYDLYQQVLARGGLQPATRNA